MAAHVNQRGSSASSNELNPGLRARQALESGDFKLARQIAEKVLHDSSSSQDAKAEAQVIFEATKVDRAPLIAGLVMLLVLAVVFAFVLHQHSPA